MSRRYTPTLLAYPGFGLAVLALLVAIIVAEGPTPGGPLEAQIFLGAVAALALLRPAFVQLTPHRLTVRPSPFQRTLEFEPEALLNLRLETGRYGSFCAAENQPLRKPRNIYFPMVRQIEAYELLQELKAWNRARAAQQGAAADTS